VVGMRLTVVRCSGSMPGPHSPASCYLLEADGFRLVVDLGNGALGPLQLIVTHLAPDIDPAQSLAAAAGAFSGPVSLAAPGQVLDLGWRGPRATSVLS
jgi:ribonuclease BN (tRNA processing enzyme)